MSQSNAGPAADQVRAVLEKMLGLMGFEAKVSASPEELDTVLLQVASPEAARLIGRGAQALDALQLLVNRIVQKQVDASLHCVVDVEHYRERQRGHLRREAMDAADLVEQTGRPVTLEPMPATDRRVVHQALKDHPRVTTRSVSSGPRGEKSVVVAPKDGGPEPESATPGDEDDGGDVTDP